jgi:hypothetical protein
MIYVLDTEIIGLNRPTWLVCCQNEEGVRHSFWSKKADKQNFTDIFLDPNNTWVTFNGNKFDVPLITMWLYGYDAKAIKAMANQIITQRMNPWEVYQQAGVNQLEVNHIDLIDVAPGVMTSLKVYAGRMFYPSMVDLPFEHDKDLKPKERLTLEEYCFNDLGVTWALYKKLEHEIKLRQELSEVHGIDLRSKSDAQVAEAILKKAVGLVKTKAPAPLNVQYKTPSIIKTTDPVLLNLIADLEKHPFKIKDGSPELPTWLTKPVKMGNGVYQVGIGGLHSKHDKQVHYTNEKYMISDFDVVSYYPSIMLNCGITPNIGGKGPKFIEAYRDIYTRRLEAKRAGDKRTANALKISLNGTFGKLGSVYSALYSPDLLLAVTITGQLNLLVLIAEFVKIPGVKVLSANTDGVMVSYAKSSRRKVLAAIKANAETTGFEYEETSYRRVAMKDVNNYVAITVDEKVKAKGLYADTGLMKNPTMPICSKAAQLYLLDGTLPEVTIHNDSQSFVDYTAVRSVKGGGEQSGIPLGRVVRWYMTTEKMGSIRYCTNGNLVPKTEGARACMVLPESFPNDLDRDWYVQETYSMLKDMGVPL